MIELPDESLMAYVADVSDKGVPAALIMAALSSKIRSESRVHNDIGQLLSTINNSMYNLISEEGFFATIVIVRFWPKSGKIQLALAGHLQPLWITKGGLQDLPKLDGVSLGVTANANYDKKEITLSSGESILLYSDGLIEAENEGQELFGNERLIRYAKEKKDRRIGEGLLGEIRKWRGNATINDDLTMLEIWRD